MSSNGKEKKLPRYHDVRKKTWNLEKLSESEIQQIMETCSDVESDVESDAIGDFDDDDSINDPDFEVSREDEELIEEYVEHMGRSLSADFLSCNVTGKFTEIEQTGESSGERDFEVVPQAGTSSEPDTTCGTEALPQEEILSEAMVTEYPRVKDRRVKRPHSPLPLEEPSGPNIPSNDGGFVGNPNDIIPKSKEFQNIVWRKKHLQLHRNEVVFRGNERLPERFNELHTPFDCFSYFVNDELLTNIANYTNLGARQLNVNTTFKVSSIDIRQYIGTLIYMSVYRYPSLEEYWGEHSFEAIRTTMTSKRFYEIRKYIRFNDFSIMKDRTHPEHDPLFKIRSVSNHLNERFDSIPKLARLCVDEQMCSTKMISVFRQYMPKKPHKWGMKSFVLCDSSGFSYRFEVYCGKNDNVILPDTPDLGATGNVVVRLSQTVPNFKNHIIYTDNFYTSLPLLVYLRSRGMYALGTIRADRIPNCKLPKDNAMTAKQRGYSEEYVGTAHSVDITTVIWKDNKSVRLASTYVGVKPHLTTTVTPTPSAKISRYERKNKRFVEVDCPRVIREYNHHMGGVDLMDGLIGRYHIRLKTKSASLKLFYHFIDMAMVNAYLLHRRIHEAGGKQMRSTPELPKFRCQVANSLCCYQQKSARRPVGRPSSAVTSPATAVQKVFKKSYGMSLDARYDDVGHMPDQLDRKGGKRTCKNPGCKSETQMYCLKCKVNLCLSSTKKCYQMYHTKP